MLKPWKNCVPNGRPISTSNSLRAKPLKLSKPPNPSRSETGQYQCHPGRHRQGAGLWTGKTIGRGGCRYKGLLQPPDPMQRIGQSVLYDGLVAGPGFEPGTFAL